MNPFKRLLGQTAIYGLSSIVGRLLNYLLVPLYTRVFLPEEYGVVTELYAYVVFLLVLLTYGMETAFFRFADNKNYTRGLVFSTAMLPLITTSLLFIGIVLLFSGNIASGIGYEANAEYIRWFAIIVGLDALTAVPFAYLRQQNKALKFAVIKLINIGSNIGFNLFFILLCPYLFQQNPHSIVSYIYNPEIGVGYIFISNLIASVLTAFLLAKEFLEIRFKISKQLLKELFVYALPLLVVGFAGSINEVIDRVLLKYLTVVPENATNSADYIMAQIGIYGANYKVSIFMTLFIQTFRYAAEPFFFKRAEDKNAPTLYADVMKYFLILCFFIFLGITLFIDVVKYFIGSEYYEGLHIVPVLLLANLFLGVIFNLSIWYKLANKTGIGAYISLIGAAITLVFNFLLIPYFGYTGSAYATLLCYASMAIISYFWGKKYYDIPYNLRRIGLYSFITALIYFLSIVLKPNQLWAIFVFNIIWLAGFALFVAYKENLLKYILKKIKP